MKFVEMKYFSESDTKESCALVKLSFILRRVGWLLETLYSCLVELFHCFQNQQLSECNVRELKSVVAGNLEKLTNEF